MLIRCTKSKLKASLCPDRCGHRCGERKEVHATDLHKNLQIWKKIIFFSFFYVANGVNKPAKLQGWHNAKGQFFHYV